MTAAQLRVYYTSEANREFEQWVEHFAVEAGEHISLAFIDALDKTTSLFAVHPQAGFPCDFKSRSHRNMRRFPLSGAFAEILVFYTPTAKEIRVERIVHGARNWQSFFV